MLMTVTGKDPSASNYGELAGIRVLITGISPVSGVDVARAFADHRGRLIVHAGAASHENDVVATLLAQTASQIELFTEAYTDAKSATRFAQGAAQKFGGLDAIVNLIPISAAEIADRASLEEIEELLAQKLELPLVVSRIVANRMKLLLTEGLVLNVVTMPAPRSAAEAAIAGIVRTALAEMTRGEAVRLSADGIRVNAIGPRAEATEAGACLASEPDIAALALYLASKRGRTLTGHIFDAAGVAARRC
jgi:NAD(P)-dependent dehydrogenase (short-subunit alcohol dehydrogenase family)